MALLSNSGSGMLANFCPPPVPQPMVALMDPGDLLWTGEPKWICSSSSVVSMMLVLARSRAWPRSSVFIGALFAGRSPVRCHHHTERSKPKLGALEAFIERVLEEDRHAPRKQRHTARPFIAILTEFPDAA